jgi:hypothetical protein
LPTFPSSSTSIIGELTSIEDRGTSVSIGAVVRQRAVELSPVVRERLLLLAHATGFIGHFQIRNRGTIGGSLAHADAAAEYPAVAVALGLINDGVAELLDLSGGEPLEMGSFGFQGGVMPSRSAQLGLPA